MAVGRMGGFWAVAARPFRELRVSPEGKRDSLQEAKAVAIQNTQSVDNLNHKTFLETFRVLLGRGLERFGNFLNNFFPGTTAPASPTE